MAQKLECEIVTVERVVYRGEASMVIAPGLEGDMGILPRHAPLLAALREGELVIRGVGGARAEDISIAIGGGFVEVLNNRVVVLADSAERADEIDEQRAQAARDSALQQIANKKTDLGGDLEAAEAALRRSSTRLKVAQRRQRRRSGPSGPGGETPSRP